MPATFKIGMPAAVVSCASRCRANLQRAKNSQGQILVISEQFQTIQVVPSPLVSRSRGRAGHHATLDCQTSIVFESRLSDKAVNLGRNSNQKTLHNAAWWKDGVHMSDSRTSWHAPHLKKNHFAEI
jgi:hypothetical protein